jgi:translation initiation factor 1
MNPQQLDRKRKEWVKKLASGSMAAANYNACQPNGWKTMATHRNNDAQSGNSRRVYSTDTGRLCPGCERPIASCICKQIKPPNKGDGIARLRYETKGRGGKGVTVIADLGFDDEKLKALAKMLKAKLSVGGSLKEGTIELQGDQRAACAKLLREQGLTVKGA